mgnify:CR=1 FL=1
MLGILYHRDLGFPAGLQMPRPGALLEFSRHAIHAAADDHVTLDMLPLRLPAVFEVVEATTFAGRAMKWLVRLPLHCNVEGKMRDTGKDLVLALGLCVGDSNCYDVNTVFVNDRTDTHRTLRRERYAAPERV